MTLAPRLHDIIFTHIFLEALVASFARPAPPAPGSRGGGGGRHPRGVVRPDGEGPSAARRGGHPAGASAVSISSRAIKLLLPWVPVTAFR